MFDDIAKTYDVANRILSFGIDKSWRKEACNLTYDKLGTMKIDSILDVACGTGDMCEFWDKIATDRDITIDKITGIDPSVGMLEEAKKKGLKADFIEGQAKDLPCKENRADILSISYGLRNVVDRKEGLTEFHRVLKPDGLLVILEFTKLPKQKISAKVRDFYMKKVLPLVGGFLSKNYNAYTYLPDSIDDFLTTENLTQELQEVGFKIEVVKGNAMDISTLFIARKI